MLRPPCAAGAPRYGAQGFGFVTGAERLADPALRIPELGNGFVPAWWYGDEVLETLQGDAQGTEVLPSGAVLAADLPGRLVPLCYRVRLPAGRYRVCAVLEARQPCAEALLFLGRRRLCWRGALAAGQRAEAEGLCDVSPIIPRGQTGRREADGLEITLAAPGVRLCALRVEQVQLPAVYIMGDSTVTDQPADLPYAPGASYAGWGQMLPLFLGGQACVSNHAHSGLTTESFRTEGHYDILLDLVRPGDLVLMQFGHNDQKLPRLQAGGGYRDRLAQYIAELRAVGARPVLVTPLARNSWHSAGRYNDLLAAYAAAVLELGAQTGTPVVDLHADMMQAVCAAGLEGAKRWFYPGDYTHTNDFGACMAAGFVAAALARLGLVQAAPAAPWEPHGPFAPLQPPADTKLAPPEGAGPAFAEYDELRPHAPLTRAEALALVISAMHFFPINVYNDLYEDVVGHEPYAGTVQCAAQNGLIPPDFVADGCLHPQQAVSLQEFLRLLMRGCASRRTVQPSALRPSGVAPQAMEAVQLALGAGLVTPGEDWDAPLPRNRAAALCRALGI